MKRFIAIWIILSATLKIWQCIHIKKLEKKRPIVIYKADNQGAEIFGKVVEKRGYGKQYNDDDLVTEQFSLLFNWLEKQAGGVGK